MRNKAIRFFSVVALALASATVGFYVAKAEMGSMQYSPWSWGYSGGRG